MRDNERLFRKVARRFVASDAPGEEKQGTIAERERLANVVVGEEDGRAFVGRSPD